MTFLAGTTTGNQVRPLKTGQVGVGHFGGFRRDRMRETGLFDLTVLYDWNEDRLAQAAQEENARAATSYEALLDEPGLEAVVISTGADFHAKQAVAAMRRGLHVFVEKPVCATPEELELLVQVQRETGVFVGLGHHDHRHLAVSRCTKQLIEAGELGTIVAVEKTTAHSGGFEIKPGDWRGRPDKNPGGMLFQCGVHALHELTFYFGPVAEVFAYMRSDVHSTLTADAAMCHLKFESGVIGTLNAYHVTPYRHALSIFGTDATLYRDERFGPEGTRLLRQNRINNSFEPQESVVPTGEDDLCGNLKSFYRAVRYGEDPYPSLLDGAQALAPVFAAEVSAKEGRPVAVPNFHPLLESATS